MNGMMKALVIILLSPFIITAVIFVIFLIKVGVEQITPDRELQVVLNVVIDGFLLYVLNRKLDRNPTYEAYLVEEELAPDDEYWDDEDFREDEDEEQDATSRSE